MLLIKRTLAELINAIISIVLILVIYPLFNYSKIELEDKYFILLILIIAFFIPILVFKATIGYKILNISCNSPQRLFFKYFVYYILISGVFWRFMSFGGKLSNISFSIDNPFAFIFYPLLALILINIALFIFSLGRYGLLDFILNITYSKYAYKRSSVLFLFIWLTFFYLASLFFIEGKKSYFNDYMTAFLKMDLNYSFTSYYPKEIFDEFMYFQTEKIDNNNNTITLSDGKSFYEDIFLGQKTIFAAIKKQTFENEIKRYIFCNLLIYHSYINDVFGNVSENISQTKLVLIYNEPQTYLSQKTSIYCYYYDNKNNKYGVYGGVNMDSLIVYKKTHIINNEKLKKKAILQVLNITEDSLKSRSIDGKITLSNQDEIAAVTKKYFELINTNNVIPLTIIPFGAVKPIVISSISTIRSDAHYIEFTNNQYWDEKLFEAVAWRNFNYCE